MSLTKLTKNWKKLLKAPGKAILLFVAIMALSLGLLYFGSMEGVDWVIVGGESGPKRRDCGVDAIIDVVHQCQSAHVPCWCKQDCAPKPGTQGRIPDDVWKVKELPR